MRKEMKHIEEELRDNDIKINKIITNKLRFIIRCGKLLFLMPDRFTMIEKILLIGIECNEPDCINRFLKSTDQFTDIGLLRDVILPDSISI